MAEADDNANTDAVARHSQAGTDSARGLESATSMESWHANLAPAPLPSPLFPFEFRHVHVYELVSLHMCVLPYIYRKILKMLPKLMEICENMGSSASGIDWYSPYSPAPVTPKKGATSRSQHANTSGRSLSDYLAWVVQPTVMFRMGLNTQTYCSIPHDTSGRSILDDLAWVVQPTVMFRMWLNTQTYCSIPYDTSGRSISNSNIAPFLYFKMVQNLDLRCVLISDPSTLVAGAKARLHTPKAVTYHTQSQIMNHT